MKFIDELPEGVERRAQMTKADLEAIRANPGQWAEIARYGGDRNRTNAWSSGRMYVRRHPGLEYAVRTVDGERVLYLRSNPSTDKEN